MIDFREMTKEFRDLSSDEVWNIIEGLNREHQQRIEEIYDWFQENEPRAYKNYLRKMEQELKESGWL